LSTLQTRYKFALRQLSWPDGAFHFIASSTPAQEINSGGVSVGRQSPHTTRGHLSADGKTIGMGMSSKRFGDQEAIGIAKKWSREHGLTGTTKEPDWYALHLEAENRLSACELKLDRERKRTKALEQQLADQKRAERE
jgi:hypothetical protein